MVKPDVPVSFFCDLAGYARSPVRIVTLALDTSDVEFEATLLPAGRVDVGAGLTSPAGFEATLSAYFERRPHRRWFSLFAAVRNGVWSTLR